MLAANAKAAFQAALSSCKSLYRHCLVPYGLHTEAGVEAAFLQMFKAWESFQEDCAIAFMCGEARLDGLPVVCHVITANDDIARKVLYQERPYVEWTDADRVVERFNSLFPLLSSQPYSLLTKPIKDIKRELGDMKIIRNAIAHSSSKVSKGLQDLATNELGGNPRVARPFDFLNHNCPTSRIRSNASATAVPSAIVVTFFDLYANALEIASIEMAGLRRLPRHLHPLPPTPPAYKPACRGDGLRC